jgi:serine/threonine protein kinase
VLLKTAAHSLKILHDLHIVHSDLKPSNILIKRTELGYTTKLIDFDSSYIVGAPPEPEDIVGTMNYYSPELIRYIQGDAHPNELTEASDIFALGLIYAEYLTGVMPRFDPAHHEAGTAVLNGETLRLDPRRAPAPVVALVDRMMLADPAARPGVGEVHATLMGLRTGTVTTTARAPLPVRSPTIRPPAPAGSGPAAPAPSSGRSALRGKGLRLAGDAARPAAGSPQTRTSAGRTLLGKLLGRREDG